MSGLAIVGLVLLIWGLVTGNLLLIILGLVCLLAGGGVYGRSRTWW